MEQGLLERFVEHEYEVADHLDHLLCYDNLLYELRGNPDDTTVPSCLRVKGQRGWVYLQVLMSLLVFDLLKPNQYAT